MKAPTKLLTLAVVSCLPIESHTMHTVTTILCMAVAAYLAQYAEANAVVFDYQYSTVFLLKRKNFKSILKSQKLHSFKFIQNCCSSRKKSGVFSFSFLLPTYQYKKKRRTSTLSTMFLPCLPFFFSSFSRGVHHFFFARKAF